MGAVSTHLVFGGEGVSEIQYVKRYLRLDETDADENLIIEDMLAAAKDDADQYLNNPFEDADGNVVIPPAVKAWVLRRVARSYERRTEGVSSQNDDIGGVSWGEEDRAELKRYRRNPGW